LHELSDPPGVTHRTLAIQPVIEAVVDGVTEPSLSQTMYISRPLDA
jgi:hypothetical protein